MDSLASVLRELGSQNLIPVTGTSVKMGQPRIVTDVVAVQVSQVNVAEAVSKALYQFCKSIFVFEPSPCRYQCFPNVECDCNWQRSRDYSCHYYYHCHHIQKTQNLLHTCISSTADRMLTPVSLYSTNVNSMSFHSLCIL